MECISLQEFEIRLNNSEISNNHYYLGLLLMHIIRLKQPKI